MAALYVLGCLSKVVRIIVYIVKFSSSKLTTLNPRSLKPQTLNPEQAVCLVLLAGSVISLLVFAILTLLLQAVGFRLTGGCCRVPLKCPTGVWEFRV